MTPLALSPLPSQPQASPRAPATASRRRASLAHRDGTSRVPQDGASAVGYHYLEDARRRMSSVATLIKALMAERQVNFDLLYGTRIGRPRQAGWLVDKYVHYDPRYTLNEAIASLERLRMQICEAILEYP